MGRFVDLTGKRFFRLLVKKLESRNPPTWLVVCDCGTEKTIKGYNLLAGETKSCGCIGKEKSEIRQKKISEKWPEYNCWVAMKSRCFNKNNAQYHNYGGRGITICERWLESFDNFYADMGPRPTNKHSLDRIDNNGNYSPENCRWATQKQQARNKRYNVFINIDGESKTIAEWAEINGIRYVTAVSRINTLKWSPKDAVTIPIKKSPKKQDQ
jgi:hypothetical protein